MGDSKKRLKVSIGAWHRAKNVYDTTLTKANWLATSQFLMALFGGLPHLIADGAALTIYIKLWNEVRDIYGKGAISVDVAKAYLWPNLPLIIGDLILDKGLGLIPIAGSVFCYWFARAITFRLAALFGVLAAIDDEVSSKVLIEKVARLIQELYPRRNFFFTFLDPDQDIFIDLIASMEGLSAVEAETRIERALRELQGNANSEEVEPEVSDADFEVEVVENLQQYGIVLWNGAVLSVEDEEPVITVDEEQQRPLPLEDEIFNTPVAVIPESLTRYLFPEEMQPNLIRETGDDTSDAQAAPDVNDKPDDSSTGASNAQTSTDKRKHVTTGRKPTGRPKSNVKGSQ